MISYAFQDPKRIQIHRDQDSSRIHRQRATPIDDAAVFADGIALPRLAAARGRVSATAAQLAATASPSPVSWPTRLARLDQAVTTGEYTPRSAAPCRQSQEGRRHSHA
jgi:hypothetical protein